MSDKTVLSIQDIVQETGYHHNTFRPARATIKLPVKIILTLISEIEGRGERRSYSLCSSPYIDDNLSVTVKGVKGGKMSNHLNNNVKVGDAMAVLPPMGNFKFNPENTQRHIILIGGGSGITPLFSIIKSTLLKEPYDTPYLLDNFLLN